MSHNPSSSSAAPTLIPSTDRASRLATTIESQSKPDPFLTRISNAALGFIVWNGSAALVPSCIVEASPRTCGMMVAAFDDATYGTLVEMHA